MKSILPSFQIDNTVFSRQLLFYKLILQFVAVIDKLITFRGGEERIQNYYIETPDIFFNFVITCLISKLSVRPGINFRKLCINQLYRKSKLPNRASYFL